MSFKGTCVIITATLVWFLYQNPDIVDGRLCYSCDTTSDDWVECASLPEAIKITNYTVTCSGYCTIERKEYYLQGEIGLIYLKRGCNDTPEVIDLVDVGEYYVTYYRSCRSHLCNYADGLTSLWILPADIEDYYIDDNEVNGAVRIIISKIWLVFFTLFSFNFV